MKTQVVNVRDYPKSPVMGGADLPFIYVGRFIPGRFYGHQLANPFKLSKRATEVERIECLEKYKVWLAELPEAGELLAGLAEQVEATGKPLGCWCAPELCHADVLAAAVDLLRGVT